jgi:hypothetical protein
MINGGSCTQVSRPEKQETGASGDTLHNLFHHELLNPITDEQ